MSAPRVKHPVYGWGRVLEILMVHEPDGRLSAGDVGVLFKADGAHTNEPAVHVVVDASMPFEGTGRFVAMVREWFETQAAEGEQ